MDPANHIIHNVIMLHPCCAHWIIFQNKHLYFSIGILLGNVYVLYHLQIIFQNFLFCLVNTFPAGFPMVIRHGTSQLQPCKENFASCRQENRIKKYNLLEICSLNCFCIPSKQ